MTITFPIWAMWMLGIIIVAPSVLFGAICLWVGYRFLFSKRW